MRRALAILKYVPAALCGLLVVAWVVSLFVAIGVSSIHYVGISGGYILVEQHGPEGGRFVVHFNAPKRRQPQAFRFVNLATDSSKHGYFQIFIPISLVFTICLPLATLPFVRFPLWSYFVWTALIAVELAYYLR